jgi:hypothetical protein
MYGIILTHVHCVPVITFYNKQVQLRTGTTGNPPMYHTVQITFVNPESFYSGSG